MHTLDLMLTCSLVRAQLRTFSLTPRSTQWPGGPFLMKEISEGRSAAVDVRCMLHLFRLHKPHCIMLLGPYQKGTKCQGEACYLGQY